MLDDNTQTPESIYRAGRSKIKAAIPDINEYGETLHGVAAVLKTRGVETTARELSDIFHDPLVSVRPNDTFEMILNMVEAVASRGLRTASTPGQYQSGHDWRGYHLSQAMRVLSSDSISAAADQMIDTQIKQKYPKTRRNTKRYKELKAKVLDKAIEYARADAIAEAETKVSEYERYIKGELQREVNDAENHAQWASKRVKIILGLNPESESGKADAITAKRWHDYGVNKMTQAMETMNDATEKIETAKQKVCLASDERGTTTGK